LNRVRDPAEPSLIVAPFEDVDLSDGHGVVSSPSVCWLTVSPKRR
jgi:hypothetical protein